MKKKTICGAGLLIAALVVELLCWLNNGKGEAFFAEDVPLHPVTPTYQDGYGMEGGYYSPTDDDPRLGFVFEPEPIETVVVRFAAPLLEETEIQLYYAGEGQELSEKRMLLLTVPAGEDLVVADLPGGVYTHLRLDINGAFSLGGVWISGEEAALAVKKGSNDYLQLGFECGLILGLGALLWHRFFRERKPAAGRSLKSRRRERLTGGERGYVLACLLLCFVWSCLFASRGYGPDEPMRYDIPDYIFKTGLLPRGDEPPLIDPIWGFSYGFSLKLPYFISAAFMRIVSFYTSGDLPLLIAARFTSVASCAGVAYYALRIGKRRFSDTGKWIFALLMTLTPQIVFLGSYVNLDAFALFVVMMIIDGWMECLAFDWDRRSGVRMGALMGLCFLSYDFAYSYILATFLLYCAWWAMNRKRIPFSAFLKKGLLILAVVLLVSGWYFARNAILYQGDLFALRAPRVCAEVHALPEFKPSLKDTFQRSGVSILGMIRSTGWLKISAKSAVSVLGYMSVYAPKWVYWSYFILFLAGVLLAGVGYFSRRRDVKRGEVLLIGCMLTASAVTIGLSAYYSWAIDFQAQGRYIIYAYPALAFLVAAGFEYAGEKADRSPGMRAAPILLVGLVTICSLIEAFLHCVQVFLT